MNQIFKNKRFIFALSFFILINVSFIVNVSAETDHYDENNVMYRLIFDDTQLKDFVNRDFALYYNAKDMQNKDIAKLTSQSGSYNYSIGFAKEKKLNILIYETSKTWQQNRNEKYIAIILPDYYSGTGTSATIHENVKAVKNDDLGYLFKGDRYIKFISNENYLNFNKNEYDRAILYNYLADYGGDVVLIIAVDKEGNVSRKNNLYDTDKNLYNEIANSTSNLIYSSVDVYNDEGTEIIKPKEDFEIKKNVEEQIEIVKGEVGKNIKFKYNNLKENYLIDIKRKDVETKKNLEWKYNPIRPNITFSTIEFEDLTDSYIFERTVYDENKNIIFQKEEIIEFGGLFDEINENSGVNDYFGFIKIFLKKASAIVSPIFEIFNYFFKNLDPFLQLGTFVCFTVLIIYFILRGVRK